MLAIFDNTGDVTASISKRPDLSPIADILDEQGDEIFSQADSILLEIDMEKDIVKRTFALAEKYHKPVYAVVSNMSIAIERRDFLRSVHCFICNQQEAGILFSENYDNFTPDEMLPVLHDKIRSLVPHFLLYLLFAGIKARVRAVRRPARKRPVRIRSADSAGRHFHPL